MEALKRNRIEELSKKETELYKALDKGINDMENGCVVPHDEAMKMIRERLKDYGL